MSVKSIIKGIIPKRILQHFKTVEALKQKVAHLEKNLVDLQESVMWIRHERNEKSAQHLSQKLRLKQKELKVYSQNGEDGILLYIYSLIGTTNQRFVEFGVEDGKECNTANLSLNLGWSGLLIEGSPHYAELARKNYESFPAVKILNSFITAENINSLCKENFIEGEIDLLSIDIDGNDLWVWKNIHAIDPRVVVIEYNAYYGKDRSITGPYDPAFSRLKAHQSGFYFGASLNALARIGQEKGYILIGCDSKGCNAFFVKREIATRANLAELTPSEAYYPNTSGVATRLRAEEAFAIVKDMPFIEL